VIAKNKDVIDAFGGTWEAVSSTSESFFKDMVRAGTAPLFEEAKNNLKAMNDYLEPLMPQIEKALTMGTSGAMHLMGQMVAPNSYAAEAATNQSAGMGFYEAVPTTLSQLGSIGAELMTVFSAVVEVVNSASNAIMGPLMAALPGLTAVLDVVAYAFRVSLVPVLYVLKIGFDVLGYTLTLLMKALSFGLTLIVNIFTIVVAKIRGAVEPMVEIFHWVGKQIQDAFDWIAKKFHISGSEYGPEAPGLLDAIGDMAAMLDESAYSNLGLANRWKVTTGVVIKVREALDEFRNGADRRDPELKRPPAPKPRDLKPVEAPGEDGLFLVFAGRQKSPVYAVRAPSKLEAIYYVKSQHPADARLRVDPDDGTASRLGLPVMTAGAKSPEGVCSHCKGDPKVICPLCGKLSASETAEPKPRKPRKSRTKESPAEASP
jgi:hypothetical protein